MNNLVEILYKRGEKYPKVLINGEEISRYMELSDYIFDDIYLWADKLYESMDDELSESYRVELTGHAFHYEVLQANMHLSRYCNGVRFTELKEEIPMLEKFRYARKLNADYSITEKDPSEQVMLCCADPAAMPELEGMEAVLTAEATYYGICRGEEDPKALPCKLCIKLGSKLTVRKGRAQTVLEIPEDFLAVTVDYLNEYHVRAEFVSEIFTVLGNMDLPYEKKMEFEAYSREEYRILATDFPETLDLGKQFEPTFRIFPTCMPKPIVFLRSDNPDVIRCDGTVMTANREGNCQVTVRDGFGNEYDTKTVRVEKHCYISNISIIIPATTMNVDENMHIRCIMTPAEAEDMKEVRYSVSDEKILTFSSKNELYALSAGRVKVTVHTPRVSSSVYITVLSSAVDVMLPTSDLEMKVNSEATVCCSVVPSNASPMPEAEWFSSNNRVLRVVSAEEHQCKIRSFGAGEATLTCALKDTEIRKEIRIRVEKEKGCYVATAVYGSYDCPQVWTLRRFRDGYLASRGWGRAFIRTYYAVSPKAVKLFGRTRWFNRLWRGVLDRMVGDLRNKGYEDTPYKD